MTVMTLRSGLQEIIDNYHGYDPKEDSTHKFIARLFGHGPTGYVRKMALVSLMQASKLEVELLKNCIDFYAREIVLPYGKGSTLLANVKKVLTRTLGITEDEIKKSSPMLVEASHLGVCDGTIVVERPDLSVGFLNVLGERKAKLSGAIKQTMKAA